jgi:hypothetical protein
MNMDFEVLIIRIQVDNMCGRLISSAIRESRYAMKIGEYSFEANAMGCFLEDFQYFILSTPGRVCTE